jgi:hypothetical protein
MINAIRSNITTALTCSVLLGTAMFATAAAPTFVGGGINVDFSAGPNYLAFSAHQKADGSVTGQGQLSFRADGTTESISFRSHFRIDCMHFLDDNTVILGGVVTYDSVPEFIGDKIVFVLRDNGQGKGGAPDEISVVYYSLDLGWEIDCEVGADLIESGEVDVEDLLFPIEGGDIQIKR